MKCAETEKLFVRKKKLVTRSGTGLEVFYFGDKGRRVELKEELDLRPVYVATDAQTLLTTARQDKIAWVDLTSGETKVVDGISIEDQSGFLVFGDWVYFGVNGLPVRMAKDPKSYPSVSIEGVQSPSFVRKRGMILRWINEMGGKIVCFYSETMTENQEIVVFSLELKLLKRIAIPLFSYNPQIRKLDNSRVILMSPDLTILVVDIETEESVKSTHEIKGWKMISFDVFPEAQSPIFVYVNKGSVWEVQVFSLSDEVNGAKLKKEAVLTKLSGVFLLRVLDTNILFVTDGGYSKIWWYCQNREKLLLCEGPYRSWREVTLLPGTDSENRKETERLKQQLKDTVLSVPSDVLGIIAGFI